MTVVEFTSIVQHNGQELCGLDLDGKTSATKNDPGLEARCEAKGLDPEEEDPSDTELCDPRDDMDNARATLVRVPKTFAKEDVESWPLADFAPFEVVETVFDFDLWGFEFEDEREAEVLNEYSDFTADGSADRGVWASSKYPGEWLVCFLTAEYEAFVAGGVDPDRLPRAYYGRAFDSRGLELPVRKSDAFAVLARGTAPPGRKTKRADAGASAPDAPPAEKPAGGPEPGGLPEPEGRGVPPPGPAFIADIPDDDPIWAMLE